MDQIEAFILAGGASRRMGTDKSRLSVSGRTFLEQLAGTMSEIGAPVTVVGRDCPEIGLKSVVDNYPKWGALGGVQTALSVCRSEWALIVACDLPFVTSGLLRLLASLRGEHEAVVPIQADAKPQPLCALYQTNPALDHATHLIESGYRRPLDLIEKLNTRWVQFAELQDLPGADKFFVNINTPEDYYAAFGDESGTKRS